MMAIKIAGTEVISQNRTLNSITGLDAGTASVIAAAVPASGDVNQYLQGQGQNWYFVNNTNTGNNTNSGIYQAIGRRGLGTYVAFIIGGGGGGAAGSRAGTNTSNSWGFGGGGGGLAKVVFTLNANTNYTCAIGLGGTGADTKGVGNDGGATTLTIGNTLVATANGGKGGPGVTDGSVNGYTGVNPLNATLSANGRYGAVGGYGVIESNGDGTNFTVNESYVTAGGYAGYMGNNSAARQYKSGATGGGGVSLFMNAILNSSFGYSFAAGGWQTSNSSQNHTLWGGSPGGSVWGLGKSNQNGKICFPALRSTLSGGASNQNTWLFGNAGPSGVTVRASPIVKDRARATKVSGNDPGSGDSNFPYQYGGDPDERTYFGSVGEGGFVAYHTRAHKSWGMVGGVGTVGGYSWVNDPEQDDANHGGPFSGGGGTQNHGNLYNNSFDFHDAGHGGMYGGGGGGGHSGPLATDSAVNSRGGDGGYGTIIIAKVL